MTLLIPGSTGRAREVAILQRTALDAGDTTTRPTDGSCRSCRSCRSATATARRSRRTGVAAGARTAYSPARAGPPTVAATTGHAPVTGPPCRASASSGAALCASASSACIATAAGRATRSQNAARAGSPSSTVVSPATTCRTAAPYPSVMSGSAPIAPAVRGALTGRRSATRDDQSHDPDD